MKEAKPPRSSEKLLDEILATLEVYNLRASYGAVAGLLGCNAWSVREWLGIRRREASWIVNGRTGVPTGYAASDIHPRLTTNDHIVCGSMELEYLVLAWRTIGSRNKISAGQRIPSRMAVPRESVSVDRRMKCAPNAPELNSGQNSVCGIDWSGARDAGRRAWVARGQRSSGRLCIDELLPGEQLPGSSSKIDLFITALIAWIKARGASVIGIDCPFGLPKKLVMEDSWEEFIRNFPSRYPTPDVFRKWCTTFTGGRELKRLTDRSAKTPFSPYNLRMFRQTYWGLHGLVHPLVVGEHVRVVPMQEPVPGKPVLAEVCPASTLNRLGISESYKGSEGSQTRARERILAHLIERELLEIGGADQRLAVQNQGGDALDAILAALAAARVFGEASERGERRASRSEYAIEGYVYC